MGFFNQLNKVFVIMVGVALSLTVIGAIIGVPMIIIGTLGLMKGV